MVAGLKDATCRTSNPELELGVLLPTHKFLIGEKITTAFGVEDKFMAEAGGQFKCVFYLLLIFLKIENDSSAYSISL